LRVEGDGAELGKSKTQISPSEGSLRIFIESGGDSEAVPERELHQIDRIGWGSLA
jgi:hypothetical protein